MMRLTNGQVRVLSITALILPHLVLSGCGGQVSQHPDAQEVGVSMIDQQLLETMFENIRNDTGWDIDGAMLWGYFFMDTDSETLSRLADSLAGNGYRIVGIEEADDHSTYVLHVERVEKHTPESLHERNIQLGSIAREFDVDTYDGMDVGPVEK